MNSRPLRVGIAGPIGAGKSEAARHLAESGFAVIDADAQAKLVMANDVVVKTALAEKFGNDVVDKTGIVFAALAKKVFASVNGLEALNGIVRMPVADALTKMIREAGTDTVLDAALIPYWGIGEVFDCCLWITAPRELRVERIVSRGSSREDAESRVSSQSAIMPEPEGDNWFFIDNIGTPAELFEAVDEAVSECRGELL